MSTYSDIPTTTDELGFTPLAEALTRVVHDADLDDTPLTLGIFGPWGSGKTSMMKMIHSNLKSEHRIRVWFDAWHYAQHDALWRALLLCVIEELRMWVKEKNAWDEETHKEQLKKFDDLEASLYRSVEREEQGAIEIQWDKAGALAANTIFRAGLSYIPVIGALSKAVEKAAEALGEEAYADKLREVLHRERTKIYHAHVQSLEQFRKQFTSLVNEFVTDFNQRMVVFIDDLDRCLPEQAIGVLEAIKVFLDIPGCIFVLGVDREVIERGIRVRYKEFALSTSELATATFPIAERDYLEKIIQIPFTLPPLAPNKIRDFLQQRLPTISGLSAGEVTQIANLMTQGLLRNPRKVKRTLNLFRLHYVLDRAHQRATHPALITKLTVIQSSFHDLYERIARDPLTLKAIEQIIVGRPGAAAVPNELRDMLSRTEQRLRDLLFQAPFFDSLSDDQLRELVYQSTVSG